MNPWFFIMLNLNQNVKYLFYRLHNLNESIFDNIITPSPSGVVGNHGEWLTDIPRSGRQYFYYDLDIDHRNNALRKIQLQNEEFKKRNLSSKFFV